MKRAIVENSVFRISVPGVDVDVAQDYQFIIHENHLISQVKHIQWVACPPSGETQFGDGSYGLDVDIAIPSADIAKDRLILYTRTSNDITWYPIVAFYDGISALAAGSSAAFISATLLSVRFRFATMAARPAGAFVLIMGGA